MWPKQQDRESVAMPDNQQQSTQQRLASEYYKQELDQVVSRFDTLEILRIQLGTFFGTANLTALGLALSSQKAGIILIAISILVIFVIFDLRLRRLCLTYLCRGIQLQHRFVPDDNETFIHILPGSLGEEAKVLLKIPNVKNRIAAVRASTSHYRSLFFQIPLLVMFGELFCGMVLRVYFNWPLF